MLDSLTFALAIAANPAPSFAQRAPVTIHAPQEIALLSLKPRMAQEPEKATTCYLQDGRGCWSPN